jgi:phosphatidylinositol glycan class T
MLTSLIPLDDIVHSISYEPSIPHERPTTLLSHLILPANSTTRILAPFLKQFLEYGEHPPDASRGFELCAAILFPLDPALPQRIHTANVLVDLPTPDFSMPYNVIIMTSTLLALFFGSIFNILTRRLVALKVDEPEQPQVPVGNTADAAAEEPVPASAQ